MPANPISPALAASPAAVRPQTEEGTLYDRLMDAGGNADLFDCHVLACALTASAESDRPLTEALGLERARLERMMAALFPGFGDLASLAADIGSTAGEDALEEPDYRQLLLDGRRTGAEIEDWLARIVARRSLEPEHLWHSLGLRNRKELSDLLHRHFPATAARNVRGMRWKKFFYREMCHAEGVFVCKSPVCDVCTDFAECFSGDD